MNHKHKIVVRGKTYEVDIDRKLLVNVDNKRDHRDISGADEIEYFRKLIKGY